MKKIFVFVWLIFFCLSISAQDFRTIQDGIEYAEMTRGTEKEPVRINLLKLDLTKVRLDVVHAMDAAIGLEKTSSIAARYGAFAAINAGFFRLDKSIFAGDATGVLQIDGKLLSEANNGRIALLISNTASACSSCPTEKRTVFSFAHLKSYGDFIVGEEKFAITGINRQRNEDDIVLFTPEFGRTPPSDAKVLEIVIRKRKIKEILDINGGTNVPRKGFVLSISGKRRDELLSKIKIGKKARIILNTYIEKLTREGLRVTEFRRAEDIVGGVPQLIRNGKIEITWEQEKASKTFVETRHPRTAVARLKDGKFLMATVDGRQEGWSVGMNLQELAAFLLELGAIDAMNLDGGGSTTMFLDGKIVNRPSDKEGERAVSDAILVFPRKKN